MMKQPTIKHSLQRSDYYRRCFALTDHDNNTSVAVQDKDQIIFRKPDENDGADMYRLVKETNVLDVNSSYSYLMWGKYFNNTSIVAELNGKIVGFVAGFIQPNTKDVLFVWQVGVSESQQGKGLASRLILEILKRSACKQIQYLEATVTPSNEASKKLFSGLANKLNTDCRVFECFSKEQFPDDSHEAEMTYRIGPFNVTSN